MPIRDLTPEESGSTVKVAAPVEKKTGMQKTADVLYPRLASAASREAAGEKVGGVQKAWSGGLDIASLPFRAAATTAGSLLGELPAAIQTGDYSGLIPSFLERFGQTKGEEGQPWYQSIGEEIARDPANVLLGLGKAYQGMKWLSKAPKVVKYALPAAEGAISGLMHLGEKTAAGEEVTGGEAAKQIGLEAGTPLLLSGLGELMRHGAAGKMKWNVREPAMARKTNPQVLEAMDVITGKKAPSVMPEYALLKTSGNTGFISPTGNVVEDARNTLRSIPDQIKAGWSKKGVVEALGESIQEIESRKRPFLTAADKGGATVAMEDVFQGAKNILDSKPLTATRDRVNAQLDKALNNFSAEFSPDLKPSELNRMKQIFGKQGEWANYAGKTMPAEDLTAMEEVYTALYESSKRSLNQSIADNITAVMSQVTSGDITPGSAEDIMRLWDSMNQAEHKLITTRDFFRKGAQKPTQPLSPWDILLGTGGMSGGGLMAGMSKGGNVPIGMAAGLLPMGTNMAMRTQAAPQALYEMGSAMNMLEPTTSGSVRRQLSREFTEAAKRRLGGE